jgi:hypothetical protein
MSCPPGRVGQVHRILGPPGHGALNWDNTPPGFCNPSTSSPEEPARKREPGYLARWIAPSPRQPRHCFGANRALEVDPPPTSQPPPMPPAGHCDPRSPAP